jgi:Mg-chelatase subunit ChlD
MNPDLPQNEREQLEAQLTAFLLGELPPDETVALCKAMEHDPELAALYERLKRTIGLVRESSVESIAESVPQPAPLQLSEERREKLLAHFKTIEPKEFTRTRPIIDQVLPWAISAVVVVFIGLIAVPNFIKSRETARKNTIINNLRLLDGAKQQWALETGARQDAEPTLEELKIYLGRGPTDINKLSVAGETYVPGKVSNSPVAELSSGQARWMFASKDLAKAERHDGKVEMDIDGPVVPSSTQATKPSVQSPAPNGSVASGSVSAGVAGLGSANDPLWIGQLENRQKEHSPQATFGISHTPPSTENTFVARNGYIALPPGQALDLDAIHNQANVAVGAVGGGTTLNYDINVPLAEPDNEATNSIAFYPAVKLFGGSSALTNVAANADSYNSNTVYRNLSMLGADSDSDKPNINYTNLVAGTSGELSPQLSGDMNVGRLPRGESTTALADANGQATKEEAATDRERSLNWYWRTTTNGSITASGGSFPAAPPAAGGPIGSVTGDSTDTAQLVQEGKRMYQLGRLDESEAKMKEALNRDPSNQAAQYYLGIAKESRDRQVVDARNVTSMQRMVKVEGAAGEVRVTNSANVLGLEASTRAPVLAPPSSAAADQIAAYVAAKEELENEKHLRTALEMRTAEEAADKDLPGSEMVTILDPAQALSQQTPSFGEKIRETFSGKVERTARITVEQDNPDIRGLAGTNVATGYNPYFLRTEFEAIQSDGVLKRVVERLNLDNGDKSKTDDAVRRLRKELDLHAEKNTKVIEIGAKSEKPEDAARIANEVAEAFRKYRSNQYEDLKNEGIQSIEQQLDDQDKRVAVTQARVDKLRAELKLNDAMANATGPESMMTADHLKELAALKVQKEVDYNQEKELLEKLKSLDRDQLKKSLPVAVSDMQLNTLLQELDLAEQNLIKLKLDLNPDHPRYLNAERGVDDLNRKIDDRVSGIMLGLESKVDASKAYLDTLNADIAAAQHGGLEGDQIWLAKFGLTNQQSDAALPKPAVLPPTPQPEILARENAFSTFSLNVSDVSFKLAAASLGKGQLPDPSSIRSEEFINAFDYRDPEALPGVPIAFTAERAAYPFAHNRELLRFSLKTAAAGRQAGRPLNIVLLLDNSGSMERADRVRIIQEALRVLAGQLQAQDTFSIVTFARTARLQVDGIPGNQAAAAAEEIAKLTPEGGTNLGEALDLAYETALHHYLANGDNRVVMLTDGAANLGEVNGDALKQKVEAHRKQGVALDCFGIGWEGYNDDLLEVLTRNGDGRYGFINTPDEAGTTFVAQIAGALHVAAADVKVQVEFNPKRVVSYRQIGYAKHQLTKEQFRDNTVDAAEIAAQEAGNALYTIETNPQGEGSIATVRVRYKVPGTSEYREQAWDVPYTGSAVALEQASPAMRLAATTSAFSEWLATSPFAAEVTPDQLLRYLNGVPQVYGADTRPTKLEWMIRQAKSISGK